MYYVGVFGYQRSYYNIKVTEARACEDNCNGQGLSLGVIMNS